ncbi:MAG: hypothetical protein HC850_17380, partial [Rhodomicrobium sp.]|nr:hypothetical protein [Rhodomicrobium sp.]
MTTRLRRGLKTIFAASASALALGASGAVAQPIEEVAEAEEEAEEENRDTIVVTGSRIARKEFTSAAPVQVIQGDVARESGLLDLTEILLTTP